MAENKLQPLLSIGIPTFNRAAYLAECLQSIIISCARYQDQVEIVVSDNASTDNSADVVRRLQAAGHPVFYVRQSSNIGGEANFRAVAECASGRYVWIFGDDDKMAPEAVGAVLEKIRQGADAVICNVALFSRGFRRLVKPRFIRLDCDISFTNPDQVMELVGGHMGYISGSILNREAFLRVSPAEYMSFAEDGASFMYAAYCVLRVCHRIDFLAEPLVLNRGNVPDSELRSDYRQLPGRNLQTENDERIWNRVFAQGFPHTLFAMAIRGYGRRAMRRAQNTVVFDYLLPRLLFLKTQGRGSFAMTMAALPYLKRTWTFWFLLLPASVLPAFLLRRLKRVKSSLASSLR